MIQKKTRGNPKDHIVTSTLHQNKKPKEIWISPFSLNHRYLTVPSQGISRELKKGGQRLRSRWWDYFGDGRDWSRGRHRKWEREKCRVRCVVVGRTVKGKTRGGWLTWDTNRKYHTFLDIHPTKLIAKRGEFIFIWILPFLTNGIVGTKDHPTGRVLSDLEDPHTLPHPSFVVDG